MSEREISDKEALDHYKKHVIDTIIAEGKDLKELKVVKMVEGQPTVMSVAEIYEHIQNTAKGVLDLIGREELEKHKRWMQYKIKRGWLK